MIHSPIDDSKLIHQIELEKLYNKNQTIPRIKEVFTDCKEFDFRVHMKAHEIDPDFGFDLLVQMVLHKRTTLPVMVGILRHHYDDGQKTADMILRCVEADLCDWLTDVEQLVVCFGISDDVQADLDRFQYPLPMVVPPKEIKDNRDNGYYVVPRGSVILRDNHHNDDVCLDHLNRVNRIKFCVNLDTALMIKNRWRNLDKMKSGETKEKFERRKRAFEKYDRTAKEVIELIIEHGNEFYLTHKYDKRGRVYCQGYHINYQGNDWNKAIVELADKEIVP